MCRLVFSSHSTILTWSIFKLETRILSRISFSLLSKSPTRKLMSWMRGLVWSIFFILSSSNSAFLEFETKKADTLYFHNFQVSNCKPVFSKLISVIALIYSYNIRWLNAYPKKYDSHITITFFAKSTQHVIPKWFLRPTNNPLVWLTSAQCQRQSSPEWSSSSESVWGSSQPPLRQLLLKCLVSPLWHNS